MTLGSLNFKVLERTASIRRQNHSFAKLVAAWPFWVLNSSKPFICPWISGGVEAMKSPSGRVEGGRSVRSGCLLSQAPPCS